MAYKTLILELEQLVESEGYTIRKEKGNFGGDSCIMEGEKLIMINKSKPVETQMSIYAKVLKNVDLNDQYLKPATWKYLKGMWQKMDEESKT
jgi:hypothetical protein